MEEYPHKFTSKLKGQKVIEHVIDAAKNDHRLLENSGVKIDLRTGEYMMSRNEPSTNVLSTPFTCTRISFVQPEKKKSVYEVKPLLSFRSVT